MASQDGKFDSFTFIPPIISNTKGTASGTVTVNNAEVTETESGGVALSKSAGSRAVGITNSSETGTLKIGDKIKFSNHDKVYVLTAGAPPPSIIFKKMKQLGFEVMHVYGLTETYGHVTQCAWNDEWSNFEEEKQTPCAQDLL